MNTIPTNTQSQVRFWRASLDIRIETVAGSTRLRAAEHYGPLRVQKPYPQADGSLHVYLLHPPGGVVGGDELNISIDCARGSRVLFTSPSAGKFYRCLEGSTQNQQVVISAARDTHVEWLPQETIFFNGASASIDTRVELQQGSSYIGWDIQHLGRKASGEAFEQGAVDQRTRISRCGQLLHRERQRFSTDLAGAPWGFAGAHVLGTLVAVPVMDEPGCASRVITGLRSCLHGQQWGVTWRGRTMLVRYLGSDTEACRDGFEQVREQLAGHGLFAGREVTEKPRIWNT